LQSVNLYENRNGKVSTFSGGMRRRLSLAISLIGNPKLIILDEPTTGMDAHIRI
jgi:ABC-2 type transport system ATP-binding protein